MPKYHLHVTGKAREVYEVEAPGAEAAERMFSDGDVGRPIVSEVEGAEVEAIYDEADREYWGT